MKKDWFKIDMSTPVPTINVFGYIGPYDEVNYADFKAAFADLESKHPECFMDINSGGGSTIDGFGMYDTVKASKMKVTCRTVAMAGSMGGILAISGVKHLINKNATFMTHKPTGGAWGEATKLTSMATLIDQMEEKAVAAFMAKTKQKEAIVRDWFKPGVDKWFTAKMCVELGIADGYIEGDEPANAHIPETFSSQKEAWEVYNKITNPNSKTDTMKKPLIDVLNKFKPVHTLDENSNDAAFAAAVENALSTRDAEIKRLTDAANADKTARVTKAVQDAFDAGKITDKEKDSTTALLNADFDAGVAMLAKIPGREDVNSLLDRKEKGEKAADGAVEDRSKWDYDAWSKNDSKGLEEMETKEPAKFKALTEAKVKAVQSKMSIGI